MCEYNGCKQESKVTKVLNGRQVNVCSENCYFSILLNDVTKFKIKTNWSKEQLIDKCGPNCSERKCREATQWMRE